jgi:response regulator of citrate/malate metabolism
VDEVLVARPLGDVLAAVKEAGVADKTIVVTAAANVERTTSHLQAGVKDVALKPYTPAELASMLA